MSNQDTKRLTMAKALRSAFHTQVMEETQTSQEITEMLVANGEDPEAIARQYQTLIAEKIRGVRKERLAGFRRTSVQSTGFALRGVSADNARLPTLDVMRERIEALSASPEFSKSTLAIAYRNGTKQSDSDISSLYQDLMELGVIKNDPGN